MNEPRPDDWMDDDLPPDPEAADAETLDLDRQLRQLLQPPVLDVPAFLNRLDSPAPVTPSPGGNAPPSTKGLWAILAVLMALILAAITLKSEAPVEAGIATLVRATGPVEVRPPEQATWTTISSPHDVRLIAGTHVRTRDESLCELCTDSMGTVRVNQLTEIAVMRPDEVELVAGQVWCRAPEKLPLRVCVPTTASTTSAPTVSAAASPSIFTCPADSETVWRVNDLSTHCISVADRPTELRSSGSQSWTIEPGFSMACSPGQEPDISGQFDRLQATSWQLPLLNQRSPNDPELQSMLQSLLATIGQSKMGGLYDNQIRDLGPAGTIPLIAYVRSPGSSSDQSRRRQAMSIIKDLAPKSALPDLMVLSRDPDAVIAGQASAAILRLQKTR